MMSLHEIIGFSISGAFIITMAFGIVLSVFIPALDRWSKRYFIALFSLMFLCAISCFLALVFWDDPAKVVRSRIIYILEGMFLATPVFMPAIFLLHYSGRKIKNNVLFHLVTVILGLYFIMLAVAQFTDVFYYVTPANQFMRGPFWPFWMMPLAVCMILNTTGLIYRKKSCRKDISSLFLYIYSI